jgi:hypothetical protein
MSVKPKVVKHLVALGLPKLTPPQVVAIARHFAQQMTGNAHFPNPSPQLVEITNQATVLENAYALSLTRAKGSVSKMHVELKTLARLLKGLSIYVETEANVDPENADNIISSSGMPVKKKGARPPKSFTAIAGKNPGTAILDNKAILRSIYIYQITTDPNNAVSWVTIATDVKVKLIKSGLSSGTRYFFRTAIITKGVQGAWSPVRDVMIA